jgi:hypothetical protein
VEFSVPYLRILIGKVLVHFVHNPYDSSFQPVAPKRHNKHPTRHRPPTTLSLQHQPSPKPETYIANKLHGVTWLILGRCVKSEAANKQIQFIRIYSDGPVVVGGSHNLQAQPLHSCSIHLTPSAPAQRCRTKSANTTPNLNAS